MHAATTESRQKKVEFWLPSRNSHHPFSAVTISQHPFPAVNQRVNRAHPGTHLLQPATCQVQGLYNLCTLKCQPSTRPLETTHNLISRNTCRSCRLSVLISTLLLSSDTLWPQTIVRLAADRTPTPTCHQMDFASTKFKLPS